MSALVRPGPWGQREASLLQDTVKKVSKWRSFLGSLRTDGVIWGHKIVDRVTSSPQVSGWSVGLLSSPLGLGHPQGESRRPSSLFLRRGFGTLGIPRRCGQRTHWAWGQVGRGQGKQSVCPRDEGQGATGRVG